MLISDKDRTAFEPRVPGVVADETFIFVRTAGMREAPEILLLELFREVFFLKFASELRARQLSPADNAELENGERAILYLARGRTKRTTHRGAREYYAPVYAEQARVAWLRQKSDRVIRDHLLRGPVAQYIVDHKLVPRAYTQTVVNALRGNSSATASDFKKREILSAAVAGVRFEAGNVGLLTGDEPAVRLDELIEGSNTKTVGLRDPLAARIAKDFSALCTIEGTLPRLQWLEFLKCFLRLGTAVWLLGHMRMTVLLRDWINAVLSGGQVPSEESIVKSLQSRGQGLFHPTTTGSGELAQHVENYMRARVEVSLMLYLLRKHGFADLFEKRIVPQGVSHGKEITIADLLGQFRSARAAMQNDTQVNLRQAVLRYAEGFGAWANPLAKGQGKNIDEFLRVLRRTDTSDDDDGYLATWSGRKQAIVFPGPMLLKTLVFLSHLEKGAAKAAGSRGKFVLADIETHFREYGVEFGVSAGARPRLIQELARMGLLKGSPDSGDSAELLPPVTLQAE